MRSIQCESPARLELSAVKEVNLQDLRSRRNEILQIANKHGASNIRVFGSLARGESGPDSDIDLLVEMESGRDLLDLIGVKQDLEAILGCRVDVLTRAAVSPYIRDDVLREAVSL